MRGEVWEYYQCPYNKGHRKGILNAEQEGSHLQTRVRVLDENGVCRHLHLRPPASQTSECLRANQHIKQKQLLSIRLRWTDILQTARHVPLPNEPGLSHS